MKTKTGTKSQVIVNIIIITVFVLGMLNTAQVNPVMASTMEDVTQQQESGPLEIAQGSSLHYSTGIEEELFFRLNVKVPAPGAAYAWKVLNPPAHGEVLVTGSGDSVEVNYIPASGYSGEDLFSVAVSDAGGNTDRIAVTVAIEAASILPDELDRIEAEAALPFMAEELEPQRMREPERILPREFEPERENQQKMDPMDVNPEDGYPLSRCGSMESGPLSDKWMVEKSRLIEQGMVAPQVSDPVIGVYLSSNEILSHNWVVGTSVTLTIDDPDYGDQDDYTASEVADEDGWVDFTFSIFELEPGQIIEMTDGTYTVTYTVANLAVTSIDEENDELSGTADPGSDVELYGCDDFDCEWLYPTAGEDGLWTATFTEVDIKPGTNGWVNQYDDEGNSTIVDWYVPDPYIRAYPLGDYIYGYEWTANASIDLTIDDPAIPGGDYTDSLSADGEGYVYFYLNNFDLKPGQIIEMTDGTYTVTYTVANLAVTSIDEENDELSGTADPGEVVIDAEDESEWERQTVIAGEDGLWTATFTEVDIKPGAYGRVYQYDDEGNSTIVYWYVPDPYIRAYPLGDYIYGYEWTANASIDLTIDDPAIPGGDYTDSLSADGEGYVYFYLNNFDLKPGQIIVMTDGTNTRTHTVANLAVTGYDEVAETLSGTADPGEVVIDAEDESEWERQTVIAGEDGLWTATFTEVDIKPGAYGWVNQYDDEGNSTIVYWYVPDPYIRAYPLGDYLDGYEWTANASIDLTIDDPAIPGGDYTDSLSADGEGYVYFYLNNFDLKPGQIIVMTDGTNTRTHTVANLAVTSIDEENDELSGTADPGSDVELYGRDDFDYEWLDSTAGEDGLWTATFTEVDIKPGAYGWVYQYDDEGNSTIVDWYVPDPYIRAYPLDDIIRGNEWIANASIDLTIDDPAIPGGDYTDSRSANGEGYVYFYLNNFDLKPGQIIVMTDGTNTRTHTVKKVAVTTINQDTDKVKGTADPGTDVKLYGRDDFDYEWLDSTADRYGKWSATFTDVDIKPGTYGWVYQYDDEGNSTIVDWYVPDPYIRAYPLGDYLYGYNWTPNTRVTLTIDGTSIASKKSDWDGWVYFDVDPFNVKSGQTVKMTDGVYSRTHVVRNIKVKEIDQALDTVSGKASAGSAVEVFAYERNGANRDYQVVTANSFGIWTADFQGSVNIEPGSYGQVSQYDTKGNSTTISWDVPNPSFSVYPDQDIVSGWEWTPGATVTLTIGSDYTDDSTASEHGSVFFNLSSEYDILPGQTISMTDGVTVKDHLVRAIAVTELDEVADDVKGTAAAGSEVQVVAFDDVSYGTGLNTTADSSGIWVADFSGYEDIKPGTWGVVEQEDDDGDYTCIDYELYKVPVIYTLGPSSAGVGSEPFTLNVNGENFAPVSKVRWNGEDRPTTFISHNQLSAEISADDLDLLGTADVQVFTPAPGGGTSNTVSFEIFGAFPAFDEKLTYSKITFEWDEIPGATLYKIQLSTKADFSTLVFSAKTASLEYPYATALNFDTTYYWRIKAKIGGYWEPWSPYMRFESMDPLANPVLTYPGPGAEVDTATPTFTWDPVENGAQYMIQISKSKTFDTIILKPKVTDTEYTTITSLANGRYFWRVRAYDSSGVKGPWSEIRKFTVAVP